MALRSLLRKMPALVLRSPGPVHAASPARHMSSHLRPDPSPRLNKAFEKMNQTIAMEDKAYNDAMATIDRGWDKCSQKTKAYTYAVHGFSAFLVLRHLF